MSSSTRAGAEPPTSENEATRGAPPIRGRGRSASALSAGSVTATVTLVVADPPAWPVATAVRVSDGAEAGTMAAKTLPCTAAVTPLTATPTSPPPATVPRTSTSPEGTVAPAAGSVMAIVGGAVWTEKARRAGVGSSLPARSRAFTSKVCGPGARPATRAVAAAPNDVKAPPSTRHAKARPVARVRLSVPPNEKVTLVSATGPSGAPVITVSGGVLSTMTVRVPDATFWPWSVAATVSVWTPSALPLVFQLAVAEMVGAGGTGSRLAAKAWLPARSATAATFPVESEAWARTDRTPRRWAFTGGARKATE